MKKTLKAQCRESFNGSLHLFEACWRAYLSFQRDTGGACEDPEGFLEQEARYRVNNPRSSFYISG